MCLKPGLLDPQSSFIWEYCLWYIWEKWCKQVVELISLWYIRRIFSHHLIFSSLQYYYCCSQHLCLVLLIMSPRHVKPWSISSLIFIHFFLLYSPSYSLISMHIFISYLAFGHPFSPPHYFLLYEKIWPPSQLLFILTLVRC